MMSFASAASQLSLEYLKKLAIILAWSASAVDVHSDTAFVGNILFEKAQIPKPPGLITRLISAKTSKGLVRSSTETQLVMTSKESSCVVGGGGDFCVWEKGEKKNEKGLVEGTRGKREDTFH